jgi:hypothetical protein
MPEVYSLLDPKVLKILLIHKKSNIKFTNAQTDLFY